MEEEIGPRKRFAFNFRELWEYRELFYFFTLRDIKIKYKQTFLGILWAIIQPLAIALILTFSLKSSFEKSNLLPVPYLVFVYSGLLLWTVFSSGLTNSANSMVSNSNIIKKIYFPRLIIPFASILSTVFDFFFALIIFLGICYYTGVSLSIKSLVCMPLGLLLTVSAALGSGILLSALTVKYRDFRYVVPFLVQGLLFLTPVLYPIKASGSAVFNTILACNPMACGIEVFRNSFSTYSFTSENILLSLGTNLLLLVAGVLYFRKTEDYFADLA